MRLGLGLHARGVTATLGGREFLISYPEEVWSDFPPKLPFAVELVSLMTYALPFATDEDRLDCDFPRSRFLERYHRWFERTLPLLRDRDPNGTRHLTEATFERVDRRYQGELSGDLELRATDERRAILPLTLGKDSLATLLLGREIGLDLYGVHATHPSLSSDLDLREPHLRALHSKTGVPVHIVRDDIKAISGGATSAIHSTGILWSMAIASYCLMMLPFAHHHRARTILLGHEQDLNYPIKLGDGGRAVDSSPLQTIEGTRALDAWISELTEGAVRVTSLIHSLHAIAAHKLVHGMRPEIGAHQVSCRRVSSENGRWCHGCRTCAESYLFSAAMRRDPAEIGFSRSMLEPEHEGHYHLCAEGLSRDDPYRFQKAEQECLALRLLEPKRAARTWLHHKAESMFPETLRGADALFEKYLRPSERRSSLPFEEDASRVAREILARPTPDG